MYYNDLIDNKTLCVYIITSSCKVIIYRKQMHDFFDYLCFITDIVLVMYLLTKSCSFCSGSGSPFLPQAITSWVSYTRTIRSAELTRKCLWRKKIIQNLKTNWVSFDIKYEVNFNLELIDKSNSYSRIGIACVCMCMFAQVGTYSSVTNLVCI